MSSAQRDSGAPPPPPQQQHPAVLSTAKFQVLSVRPNEEAAAEVVGNNSNSNSCSSSNNNNKEIAAAETPQVRLSTDPRAVQYSAAQEDLLEVSLQQQQQQQQEVHRSKKKNTGGGTPAAASSSSSEKEPAASQNDKDSKAKEQPQPQPQEPEPEMEQPPHRCPVRATPKFAVLSVHPSERRPISATSTTSTTSQPDAPASEKPAPRFPATLIPAATNEQQQQQQQQLLFWKDDLLAVPMQLQQQQQLVLLNSDNNNHRAWTRVEETTEVDLGDVEEPETLLVVWEESAAATTTTSAAPPKELARRPPEVAALAQNWIRVDRDGGWWWPLANVSDWSPAQMAGFLDALLREARRRRPLRASTVRAVDALYGLADGSRGADVARQYSELVRECRGEEPVVAVQGTTEVELGDVVVEPEAVEEEVTLAQHVEKSRTFGQPPNDRKSTRRELAPPLAPKNIETETVDTPETLAENWRKVDRAGSWLPLVNVDSWTSEQMGRFLDELLSLAGEKPFRASTLIALNALYDLGNSGDAELLSRYNRLQARAETAESKPVSTPSVKEPPTATVAQSCDNKERGATATPETVVSVASEHSEKACGPDVSRFNLDSSSCPPEPDHGTEVATSASAPEAGVDPAAMNAQKESSAQRDALPVSTAREISQPKFAVSFADMAKKLADSSAEKTLQLTSRININSSRENLPATTTSTVAAKKHPVTNGIIPSATRFVPSLSAVVTVNHVATKEKTEKKRTKKKPVEMTEEEWKVAQETEQFAEDTERSTAAASSSSFPDTCLVILVSNQTIKRGVAVNQERAFTILKSKGIAFETVDGSDPSNKEVRNNLFQVSGLGATTYPQFFVVKNGVMNFWGDMEKMEFCNETGTLEERLGLKVVPSKKAAEKTIKTKAAAPVQHATESGEEKPAAANAAASDSTESAPRSSSSKPSESTGKDSTGVSGDVLDSAGRKSTAATAKTRKTATDITIYGATSFVAKHALDYFMQASLAIPGQLKITVAGRNKEKISALQKSLTRKMSNLSTVNPDSKGKCIFDTFIADSSDAAALKKMAARTTIVTNFAGPFMKYGENVVAGCAQTGAHYLDITGEPHWAGKMRLKYGEAAAKTNARLISFAGYDSVPSDLAVFAAVEELRRVALRRVDVEDATTWHFALGLANGGTIHTALEFPVDLVNMFTQPFPHLMDDPLILTHPRTRVDPDMQETKNRLAKAEWWNQLPSMDSILGIGISAPFLMAPVNAKVVHASAFSLNYGSRFTYRERFLPVGFKMTRKMGIVSLVPALMMHFGIMIMFVIFKLPFIGKKLANWIAPPGSGSSDEACKIGFGEVYAQVTSTPGPGGLVNRGNCAMIFKGDPGNWVTAQCICESALALLLDKDKLPLRSLDGFGTPAELLGQVLLRRLKESTVRPVEITVCARNNVPRREVQLFGHN